LRRPLLLALIALGLAGTAVPALAATVDGPSRVEVRQTVRVEATGLKDGRYTLSLVAKQRPARGASCLASIGRRKLVTDGDATFRGRVPSRLRCYQGPDNFLGRIRTTPGSYRFVIGVKTGGAAFDGEKSFVRRSVRVVD